jgi:protease secretion system membrane fusion protein
MFSFLKSKREEVRPPDTPRQAPANHLTAPPSDTRYYIFAGILFLLFGFGGFLYWASTAPLDEGIPAQGVVSVESKRKTVAHLTGGIVKEILVKEAQLVEEGAPLIRLDDTTTKANYESALQTFFAMKATESRLVAEQTGAGSVPFPQELTRPPLHPLAAQHMSTQRSLFAARRAALASDLAVFEETAATYEEQAKGFDEQLEFLKK